MKFFEAEGYQPVCIKSFEYYKAEISKLLPSVRVEHIGASSIPNAISKGDLDIFIGVEHERLEQTVQLLRRLGFSEKSNTFRSSELCMLELIESDVALQVVANGSKFEFFLTFRDKLRADARLVSQMKNIAMLSLRL